MTRLTLYGGAAEIGGNKILVEDKDTKVFFDFGKSVSRNATRNLLVLIKVFCLCHA